MKPLLLLAFAFGAMAEKKYVVYNKNDLFGKSGQAKMMAMTDELKPLRGLNGFVFKGDPKKLKVILNEDWVVQEEIIHKILE